MRTYQSLSGVMHLPVVGKLRTVHCSTQLGTYERAQASLPVLAEFEDNLDELLYCIGTANLLMIGRIAHCNLPSADRLRSWYENFKQRMQKDPAYRKRVFDTLPKIAAKYGSEDIMDIVGDDEFLELIKPTD